MKRFSSVAVLLEDVVAFTKTSGVGCALWVDASFERDRKDSWPRYGLFLSSWRDISLVVGE